MSLVRLLAAAQQERYAARIIRLSIAIATFVIAIFTGFSSANLMYSQAFSPEMTTTFHLPRGTLVADLTDIHEAYSVAVVQDE